MSAAFDVDLLITASQGEIQVSGNNLALRRIYIRMNSPASQVEDQLLVRRTQAGDRQAFGDLVSRYAVIVHGLCAARVGPEHTPELAHDAFVEAWLKLSSLRDPERFAPWLRALTVNLCRQWHRRRYRARSLTADVDFDAVPDLLDDDEDALDTLVVGLARLSDDHRLALALHYAQGLSYEQIAAFLDVPMGTVMSRLHRARSNLRERMDEMVLADGDGDPGTDGFRESVAAEIEVLLQLWDEQSPDVRGRFHSEAGGRLSVLVENSPDVMRPVLAVMHDALREHASLLLLRAGGPAIAVAISCAFADNHELRCTARRVLQQVLRRDACQPLNDGFHTLPLRLTACWVLDSLIRSAQPDADKAALLVDLLPGCEDDATLILMALILCAYAQHSFPLLLSRWQATPDEQAAALFAAALSRFGTRFFAAITQALQASDPSSLQKALIATHAAANLIDGSCLIPGASPNPELERRIGGRLTLAALDETVMSDLCASLATLAAHDDTGVRDRAIIALGALGCSGQIAAVRANLQSPHASTRHAAVVGLRSLEDRDSIPALIDIARGDEPAVRRMALQALGHLGAGEALPLLADLIDDDAVRPNAISALGEIGGDEAHSLLQNLTGNPDKKVARMAANALFGGNRTPRPSSDLRRQRLAKIRGADAQPIMDVSVVAAIRHLPEIRPYPEAELTRLIGEVCGDYSTTRRELVMGSPGLMVRSDGIYELSDMGLAVWRVERFVCEHDPGGVGWQQA